MIKLPKETGIKLSPRLKAIAGLVVAGEPMADIGSDHAYLPIYLVKNRIVPSAVAVEVRPGPWKRAATQVSLHGLADKIEVRLGDGLSPLKKGEAATVVLAGMGARTITRILSNAEEILPSFKRLVIQPMAEVSLVRQWLYEHGFHLFDEELVQEGEHYYFILAAETGQKKLPSPLELEFGPILLAKKHPLIYPYVDKLWRQEERVLSALQQAVSVKANQEKQAVEKRLNQLKEVMKWLSGVKP